MMSRWPLLIAAFALLLPGPGAEAYATPLEVKATAAPVVFAPHRAIYHMSLASAKNGSSLAEASGELALDWSDACDGWAVQQRMQLHFAYAEGDEADILSTIVSWESKDGNRYNFNVRRVTNEKETEDFRGTATLNEQGGSGIYTVPKGKTVKLPPGTLFPTAHTALLLEKAMAGEKLFTRHVFDGSDEEGAADVSAFIGGRVDPAQANDLPADLRGNPLLAQPAWPIRLAFHGEETETGEPDYEMSLTLQPNGVSRFIMIDYGDFTISGALVKLEALPGSGC